MPRYKGEFRDINSVPYTILIQNENAPSTTVDLKLGEDPVTIVWNGEDRLSSTNFSDCTISIMTNTILSGFFNPTANSVRVAIYKTTTGEVKFAGFVTPNTYNQSYALLWDTMELNCTDAISTTQYLKVPDSYRESTNLSFRKLLYDMLNMVNGDYFTPGDIMCPISRMIVSDTRVLGRGVSTDILDDLYINPSNFFDDDDEKTPWYWSDVLENICQFLCLQATQVGDTLYLLDADAHANSISPVWIHDAKRGGGMFTASQVYHSTGVMPTENINLATKGVSGGSEPNITLDAVYNKICVKANRYAAEDLIPDFFEEDDIVTPQTEIAPLANFVRSKDEPNAEGFGDEWTWEHWYYVLYTNPNFTSTWYTRNSSGIVQLTPTLNQPQVIQEMLRYLNSDYIGAQVMKIGNYKTDQKDDSKKTIAWNFYLYIPVHGNCNNEEANSAPRYPNGTDPTTLPIYTYTGKNSVNLTPMQGQTNYINISGKILLSMPWKWTVKLPFTIGGMSLFVWIKPDGVDDYIVKLDDAAFDIPNTENKMLHIDYMNNGDAGGHEETDNMHNFPIIPAILKIGDKYWSCDWDEIDSQGFYTLKCRWTTTPGSFPITINPAMGDDLIGKNFDIENQFDPLDPVDCTGNKITITDQDMISGKVEFSLCAPYPSMFDDIERRHPTLFRHTKWYHNLKPILANIQGIWIQDFEIKVQTSNKSLTTVDEDDYLYYNQPVDDNYIEEWDEAEWKINTLTPAGYSLSTVMYKDGNDFIPVNELYDKAFQRSDIAERLFIRRMYVNYSKPMIRYEVDVMNSCHRSAVDNSGVPLYPVFYSPSMREYFYPLAGEMNLKQATTHLILRQRVTDI